MSLDLFNNILNGAKDNKFVQNFMKELGDYLEKEAANKQEENHGREMTNALYQVVEMDTDGAYLQNVKTNEVSKATDIPKDILESIGNDTVLRYENGNYIVEEELTQEFYDSLVGIKEYTKIQKDFENQSNILENDSDTRYMIETKEKEFCVLSYGEKSIKVPTALIPFWANKGESLYYKSGEFKRDL